MQDRVEADTNKKNGASAAPRKVEDMIVHAWQCMEKNKRFHYEKKKKKQSDRDQERITSRGELGGEPEKRLAGCRGKQRPGSEVGAQAEAEAAGIGDG
jgi:hypothetical protein